MWILTNSVDQYGQDLQSWIRIQTMSGDRNAIKAVNSSKTYIQTAGLEIFFWTNSSCGASGINFSLVLTPVELVLKSGIFKRDKTHNSVTYLQLVLGDM